MGIGELPDAAAFGDVGSNTLVNIKKVRPQTSLPNLCALGLGDIQGRDISLLGEVAAPKGCYGKMAERSIGKDTTTGHWEMAGIITKRPFPTFTETGFPKEVMDAFEAAIGTKTLGNYAESGTVIIQDLGVEHMKTGYPIVYTSADSVFQIAAHEDVIPVQKLYEMCEKARKILTGKYGVGRVIARPFIGNAKDGFTRTKNRRDFSLEPTGPTILDLAKAKGMEVVAVGKIEDIFEHRGMTRTDHTTNNHDGIEKTIQFLKDDFEGLLFTNLVDTDMIYGHRNDVEGYAGALEYFDSRLSRNSGTAEGGGCAFYHGRPWLQIRPHPAPTIPENTSPFWLTASPSGQALTLVSERPSQIWGRPFPIIWVWMPILRQKASGRKSRNKTGTPALLWGSLSCFIYKGEVL